MRIKKKENFTGNMLSELFLNHSGTVECFFKHSGLTTECTTVNPVLPQSLLASQQNTFRLEGK